MTCMQALHIAAVIKTWKSDAVEVVFSFFKLFFKNSAAFKSDTERRHFTGKLGVSVQQSASSP